MAGVYMSLRLLIWSLVVGQLVAPRVEVQGASLEVSQEEDGAVFMLQKSARRASTEILSEDQGASQHQRAFRAAGVEAVKVSEAPLFGMSHVFSAEVLVFVTMALLCAVSMAFHVHSQFTPEVSSSTEKSESFKPAPERANTHHGLTHALDDSTVGLSSPGHSSGRRSLIQRRNSVIVAELRHRHWTIDTSVGTMSELSFIINMVADLGPCGFLPLAAGLKHTGFVPGLVILFIFYGLCVYTMYAVARSAEITGCKDFRSQWAKAISPTTQWIPVFVVVCVTFGTLISYSCFFADIFRGVMPSVGLDMSRSVCLLMFTMFPVFPLCLVKDLSSLSYSSFFALVATAYTIVIMFVRCTDGSYKEGGRFIKDVPAELAPNVPSEHLIDFGAPSLALVNSLALAFLAHYNANKYYRELRNHSPRRLLTCTAGAMGICVLLFAVAMVAGFQTFGMNSDAVILKNYSRQDPQINAARIGMGFSIVFSFPIMFSGLREATITLLKMASDSEFFDLVWTQDGVSALLLGMITAIAFMVTDAGIVVGIVGAICGISISYIVPCALYHASIQGFLSERNALSLVWLRCLLVLGGVLLVAGAVSAVVL